VGRECELTEFVGDRPSPPPHSVNTAPRVVRRSGRRWTAPPLDRVVAHGERRHHPELVEARRRTTVGGDAPLRRGGGPSRCCLFGVRSPRAPRLGVTRRRSRSGAMPAGCGPSCGVMGRWCREPRWVTRQWRRVVETSAHRPPGVRMKRRGCRGEPHREGESKGAEPGDKAEASGATPGGCASRRSR
jgi:hypothetical protein